MRIVSRRSLPATIILGGALVIHILLALYKLGSATTLRRPPWEIVQIIFGLLIPFLLFPHLEAKGSLRDGTDPASFEYTITTRQRIEL